MTAKMTNKLDNLTHAVKRLNECRMEYRRKPDSFMQDALIKRFEFTFELAWKTLYEALTAQGHADIMTSPRPVLQKAYQTGLIKREDIWLSVLADRNLTAHLYSETDAKAVADRISMQYCKEFAALVDILKSIF